MFPFMASPLTEYKKNIKEFISAPLLFRNQFFIYARELQFTKNSFLKNKLYFTRERSIHFNIFTREDAELSYKNRNI